MNTFPVKAIKVDYAFDSEIDGAYSISKNPHLVREQTLIMFICPCGCKQVVQIPITGENSWSWNGDEDNPTLTPSIARMDGCKWHGFLTNGFWTL